MKKTNVKTSSVRKMLLIIFVVVAVITIIALLRQPESKIEHTHDELQGRYDYLLNHVSPTNVHPYLRPVHFSVGKYFAACGTLVLNTKPHAVRNRYGWRLFKTSRVRSSTARRSPNFLQRCRSGSMLAQVDSVQHEKVLDVAIGIKEVPGFVDAPDDVELLLSQNSGIW